MTKFKILIADNTEPYRKSLVELFSNDYDIIEASNPEEAEAKLSRELVHLAIVDLRLREDSVDIDQSGLELCEKMSEFIPRVLITAFPNQWEIVRRALHTRLNKRQPVAADLFSKLVHRSEHLKEKVHDLLTQEYEIPCVRRIAVLTSGGDSPGMNMAISSIVRFAMNHNVEVIGIDDGYEGLVEGRGYKLNWPYVSRVLSRRGTFLKTSRPEVFKDPIERRKLFEKRNTFDFFKKNHISGLIVIGGDGSMKGATALSEDLARENITLQTIAIPGTIDNDLYGTDMSLGAASAVNEIITELNSMVEIAVGLRRIFVIEVMGAKAGYLALEAAVAFGADGLLIPERIVVLDPDADEIDFESWQERVSYERSRRRLDEQLEQLSKHLKRVFAANKHYAFVIVAEGVHKATEMIVKKQGGPTATMPHLDAEYVVHKLEGLISNDWGVDYRLDVRKQSLGYPVRGAHPCRFDLWLGATLGRAAVQRLLDEDKTSLMVGYQYPGSIVETPYAEVIQESDKAPSEIWNERRRWRDLFELYSSLAYDLPQAEIEPLEPWTFADDGE